MIKNYINKKKNKKIYILFMLNVLYHKFYVKESKIMYSVINII